MILRQYGKRAMFEFHIARQARDRYQFDQALFTLSGKMVVANFQAARLLAQKMNAPRDLLRFPEQVVKAGQINAMGLIDELLHVVMELYRQTVNPQATRQALQRLDAQLGKGAVDATLVKFADEFPPLKVYLGEVPFVDYLEGQTEGIPNREIVLEELLLLWLANANPVFALYGELFDHSALEEQTAYPEIISVLTDFFARQPPFGPEEQHLIDLLRSPAIAEPHSLPGQLEYIRTRWSDLLGAYLHLILRGLDFLKEEEKAIFGGHGPPVVYDFDAWGLGAEQERFSRDRDWMPSLVLMAKNAYVWLDQLSRQYGREISRLDHIPDEELDRLAAGGISGLWLIGLWERSEASRRIKQRMGNPEAVASAYSLYDYQVADDLGGEGAADNLRQRAWQRGIRLASDMVPNHMGIDARWAIEHPDWFLSLDHSPFPSYQFNGPDLCGDGRVGVYLDDGYYDHSDAAVVFKRVDHHSGDTRYIYHGNDGTHMPWNDTAQLNYLKAEVREGVIQTILHVARQFPIIRFDAAMTLTKKHIQRLWFPEPGSGGAIPSRAEQGMSKAEFDVHMPQEFWREVVDRVAQEAPETLLLAEAFWLMEGYFVRTLGMHRVYNSAFMHMLRDEDNAKYRAVMKNTLEFDPQVLKRFVNFMNNPDEETAIAQFGKEDKYFGVCTMMVTLPGLPMFGHGQIEGLSEKYGMEYRRAKWDEQPDAELVARHERQIFPLLHRRRMFAEVDDFLLYDFFTPQGYVDENVFAYSNGAGEERALVVYHNKFGETHGWVKTSVAFSVKKEAGERHLIQRTLAEGLGLRDEEGAFTIFRDRLSGLEYIRSNRALVEKGLYVALEAYKAHVFLDFRQVQDDGSGSYARLEEHLNGRGVPSIEEARQEMLLGPIHHPFKELVNAGMLRYLVRARVLLVDEQLDVEAVNQAESKVLRLLRAVKGFTGGKGDAQEITSELIGKLSALLQVLVLGKRFLLPRSRKYKAAQALVHSTLDGDESAWGVMLGWLFTHQLGRIVSDDNYVQVSRGWMDEWMLDKLLAQAMQGVGASEERARHGAELVKVLIGQQKWYSVEGSKKRKPLRVLQSWLGDLEVQQLLGVNRYQGVLWFNKEAFEQFAGWMMALAAVEISADPQFEEGRIVEQIVAAYEIIKKLIASAEKAEYQVERLLDVVGA